MKRMNFSAVCMACLALGCTQEIDSGESVDAIQSAVDAGNTTYFRSNATGWGVDDATRLTPLGNPLVVARTFVVKEPWMVTGVDTATVTVTNQFNGWGTRQTFFDLASTSQRITPPSTEALTASPSGGDPHFKVDYATLGRHRVVVNLRVSPHTISLDSEADICAQTTCPPSTTCRLLPDASTSCEPAP